MNVIGAFVTALPQAAPKPPQSVALACRFAVLSVMPLMFHVDGSASAASQKRA